MLAACCLLFAACCLLLAACCLLLLAARCLWGYPGGLLGGSWGHHWLMLDASGGTLGGIIG